MTEPDFLDFLFGVWRADIESVEFPSFADLLLPSQQNTNPVSEPGGNQ